MSCTVSATSNALTIYNTLLDVYPGASSAYSTRLLSSARYNSALLRVRRSSDNAEVDVFVDTNYGLSLNSNITSRTSGTTLATWVGANSAFVTKWYDQSGNSNDAVQATAANQPTIVASGVLQTNLGKAALLFSGTTAFQATVNWTNLFSTYTVAKLNTLAPAVQAFYRDNGAVNSTGVIAFNSPRTDTYRVRTTSLSLSTINSAEFGTSTKLITLSSDATTGYAYLNNGLRVSAAVSGNVGTTMYIGSNGAGNSGGLEGPMSEWITYPSNANLTAINNSINTYYSVYPIVSDADAQAFIEATGIDSTTQANAINTLVIGMKAQGLWTKMKAVYPFVGGTVDTHKYNLKNPLNTDAAFRLSFSGTITHSSNGIQGNGVNGFANTFVNPSANLNSFNNHLSYYSRTDAENNNVEIGSVGTSFMHMHLRHPTNQFYALLQQNVVDGVTNTSSTGFYVGNRTANNVKKHFKNGVNLGTSTTLSTSVLNNYNIYISALNATGTTSNYSTKQCAFSSIGDGLTDTEAADFYTLVQAFQTSLNRNI